MDLSGLQELAGIRADGKRAPHRRPHHARGGRLVVRRRARGLPAARRGRGQIGDLQVRNRGTIGGSLAHADPARGLSRPRSSRWARRVATGRSGSRDIPVEGFFKGLFTTDLAARGDPDRGAASRPTARARAAAYLKHRHPASSYAVVGVAALVDAEGRQVREGERRGGRRDREPGAGHGRRKRPSPARRPTTPPSPRPRPRSRRRSRSRSATSTPRASSACTSPPCWRGARWPRPSPGRRGEVGNARPTTRPLLARAPPPSAPRDRRRRRRGRPPLARSAISSRSSTPSSRRPCWAWSRPRWSRRWAAPVGLASCRGWRSPRRRSASRSAACVS